MKIIRFFCRAKMNEDTLDFSPLTAIDEIFVDFGWEDHGG